MVGLRDERTDQASEVEDYIELEDLESGTGRILNRRNTMDVVSDVTLFKKGDVLFGRTFSRKSGRSMGQANCLRTGETIGDGVRSRLWREEPSPHGAVRRAVPRCQIVAALLRQLGWTHFTIFSPSAIRSSATSTPRCAGSKRWSTRTLEADCQRHRIPNRHAYRLPQVTDSRVCHRPAASDGRGCAACDNEGCACMDFTVEF